jgi:hypothetical protein
MPPNKEAEDVTDVPGFGQHARIAPSPEHAAIPIDASTR